MGNFSLSWLRDWWHYWYTSMASVKVHLSAMAEDSAAPWFQSMSQKRWQFSVSQTIQACPCGWFCEAVLEQMNKHRKKDYIQCISWKDWKQVISFIVMRLAPVMKVLIRLRDPRGAREEGTSCQLLSPRVTIPSTSMPSTRMIEIVPTAQLVFSQTDSTFALNFGWKAGWYTLCMWLLLGW